MIGDQGFDPLGITNTIPSLNYVRAAELKHGRVAMLATVGFVFQQYVHIVSSEADPLKAVSALGYGPNLQILFAIGCIELSTWDVTFTSTTPGKIFPLRTRLQSSSFLFCEGDLIDSWLYDMSIILKLEWMFLFALLHSAGN